MNIALQVITIGPQAGDCFKVYPLAEIAENGAPKEPVTSPRMKWIFTDYQSFKDYIPGTVL